MKWSEFVQNAEAGTPLKDFLEPAISLAPGSRIFTIGSCFARNIEDHLHHDFEFPIMSYQSQPDEFTGIRGRGILNKFTPTTILRELEWALIEKSQAAQTAWDWFAYPVPNDRVIDMGLREYLPVTRDRFLERRQEIHDLYQQIATCGSIIMTFGNLEQWFHNGRAIEQGPSNSVMVREKKAGGTFSFDVPDAETVEQNITRIFEILRQINPAITIIATVSPVPMQRTFQKRHVMLANMDAKMTLNHVCKKVLRATRHAHYFPSYEMINALGQSAFRIDGLHVTNEAVSKVARQFQKFVSAQN